MKINLINFLANEPKWHKHIALVQDHPTPLAMRCQPPYPSPPRYSSPPSYGSPSYPPSYEWDLIQQRQIQNNNLSSDSDYFSSSTYRANESYKGKHYHPLLPPGQASLMCRSSSARLAAHSRGFLSSSTTVIIFKCECRELELKTRQ